MIKAISTNGINSNTKQNFKTSSTLQNMQKDTFIPSFKGEIQKKNSFFKKLQNAFFTKETNEIKPYTNNPATDFQIELSKDIKTHFNRDIPPQNFENIMTLDEFKEILPNLKQENFLFNGNYEENTLYSIDLNNSTIFSNKKDETIKELLDKIEIQAKKYYDATGKKFIIALTDKDNIHGNRQAIRIIGENPKDYSHFKLLPSAKFSFIHKAPTSKKGYENSEILAYGINPFSKNITSFLDNLISKRKEMAESFIDELNELYPNLGYDVNEFVSDYSLLFQKDFTVSNLYWRVREYAENKGGNEIRSVETDSTKIYKDANSILDNLGTIITLPNEKIGAVGEKFSTSDDSLNKSIKELFYKYSTRENEKGEIISNDAITSEELFECLKKEEEAPVLAFASPYYLTNYFEEENNPNGYENVMDFMQELINNSKGLITAFESISPAYFADKNIKFDNIENFNDTIRENLNLYEVGGTFEIGKNSIS